MDISIDLEEFVEFRNKIIIANLSTQVGPVHGRLIRISNLFITLEKKDGSIISISKSVIVDIRLIKNQCGV